MITATTRTCGGCRRIVLDGEAACASCGRVMCPPVASWTPGLRKWLVYQLLCGMVAAFPGASLQEKWEFVLKSVMRSRPWGNGNKLSASATEVECFAVATKEAERWQAAGASTEI